MGVFCTCGVFSVCGWVFKSESIHPCLCVCVFYRWIYLCMQLAPHCVCVCMQRCGSSAFTAHTCIRLHVMQLHHASQRERHTEILLRPWGIAFFSLSMQLGETNRPVMQQWEALNAKHIIREEGRRRRRRAGDKKGTAIEKEGERMRYSQKWQMKV